MPQPIRKNRKKKENIQIAGIEYCNDCPFLIHNENGQLICSPNDYKFDKDIFSKINVPDWCGNKKNKTDNFLKTFHSPSIKYFKF